MFFGIFGEPVIRPSLRILLWAIMTLLIQSKFRFKTFIMLTNWTSQEVKPLLLLSIFSIYLLEWITPPCKILFGADHPLSGLKWTSTRLASVIRASLDRVVFFAILIAFCVCFCYLDFQISFFAETKSILDGLHHARCFGIQSLWIETNSLVRTYILNDLCEPPWSVLYYIRHIKISLSFFQQLRISHICREGNTTAGPRRSTILRAFRPVVSS